MDAKEFNGEELVMFKRICPYQGEVETSSFVRGRDLTDLGIRTTIVHFELDGCTDIKVSINGVDKTSEFIPSASDRNLVKERRRLEPMPSLYFRKLAVAIQNSPVMNRPGSGKSLMPR